MGPKQDKIDEHFQRGLQRALTFAVSKKCSDFGRNRTNFALDLAP
jgi:hypothetical protein